MKKIIVLITLLFTGLVSGQVLIVNDSIIGGAGVFRGIQLGGGAATWGGIGGTLTNQTDLVAELAKYGLIGSANSWTGTNSFSGTTSFSNTLSGVNGNFSGLLTSNGITSSGAGTFNSGLNFGDADGNEDVARFNIGGAGETQTDYFAWLDLNGPGVMQASFLNDDFYFYAPGSNNALRYDYGADRWIIPTNTLVDASASGLVDNDYGDITVSTNVFTIDDGAVDSDAVSDGTLGLVDLLVTGSPAEGAYLIRSGSSLAYQTGLPNNSVTSLTIVDEQVKENDLDITNTAVAGYALTSDGADGFTWAPQSGGGFSTSANYTLTGSWVFNQDITVQGASVVTEGETNVITESMINAANNPTDEYALTYEADTGQFEYEPVARTNVTNTFSQIQQFGNGIELQISSANWDITDNNLDDALGIYADNVLEYTLDPSGVPTKTTDLATKDYVDNNAGGLTADQTTILGNVGLSPVDVALSGDVNLSTLLSRQTTGADNGRRVINNESTAVERTITVDNTGANGDLWRFRTDNVDSRINLLPDVGVTINFAGNQGESGVSLSGFDQYAILRKTAANTYTASGNVVGYEASTTVVVNIDESTYDMEEVISTGAVAGGSSTLEIDSDNIVGLFFDGLSIPAGATITNAYLTVEGSQIEAAATSAKIEVERADSAVLDNVTNNLSGRTMTDSDVNWNNIEAFTDGGSFDSPDISTIIQEWVDRGSYATDDNLVILITWTSGDERRFISFNGTGLAPILTITYTN